MALFPNAAGEIERGSDILIRMENRGLPKVKKREICHELFENRSPAKRLSFQFHQKLLTKLCLSSYAESVLPSLLRKNLKPFIHPSKKRIAWHY